MNISWDDQHGMRVSPFCENWNLGHVSDMLLQSEELRLDIA